MIGSATIGSIPIGGVLSAEAEAGGAAALVSVRPNAVHITGSGSLTTAIVLEGQATLAITTEAHLLRPLTPASFSIDGSLSVPATQWDSDQADHRPWIEASSSDRMNLSMGLINALNEEQLIGKIDHGWVDEWMLDVQPNTLRTQMHGRDAIAALLDSHVRTQYIRDGLRPNLGGVLVPPLNQAAPQTFLDPNRALTIPPPSIPPGWTRKVGRWTAAMIAQEIVASAGLALSWRVPDYTLVTDFTAGGRVIDVLNTLIEPFVQVEPFRADILVEGKTVVIRKRAPQATADYTFTVKDSRITNLKIGKRQGPLYGPVHITGAPNTALSALRKPDTGQLGEAINYDPNGAPIGRVTFRTLQRGVDDAATFQERYTYGLNEDNALVIQSIETTLYNWEDPLEDPETGAMLNRPVQTGATTVVQARNPDTGLIDVAQIETRTNTYDHNKFMVGTVTSRSEKNPETGGMRVNFQNLESYSQGAGGTMKTTTVLRGDPPTLESAGFELSAGRPFGGPNAGGGGSFAPYEIFTIISTDPTAIDFEYSNAHITPAIINLMLSELQQASGMYQYTVKFLGPSMPWLHKNVGILFTNLLTPKIVEGEDPVEIVLKPALIVERKDTMNLPRPASMRHDTQAVYWDTV